MSLTPGTKLGPYEIVSPLGAGGMGEVYRAHDTRLGRDVAIKVLPTELSADPDLKQRLEREARSVSSLNHPHICQLYDIGSQDGTDFLVMELLQGEPLDVRLQKGPLPVKQVLEFGVQIADALEKAHRAGTVHRDLKPANIFLTPSGAKLLDFGLAKPTGAAVPSGSATSIVTDSGMANPTLDVTSLSLPAPALTQQGRIVGTFQYMAPEVIQGGRADARSDIFAFGCVLYEMVTGKRAFEGKSQLSVMTAILEHEPEPLSTVRPASPAALDYVVQNCLEKNPGHRFQTAHDVKLQLAWLGKSDSQSSAAALALPKRSWKQWTLCTVALLAVVAATAWLSHGVGQPKRQVMRTTILPPEGTKFAPLNQDGPPVLSSDGTRIAFVASREGHLSLWVRDLTKSQARELPETEAAYYPFWSPDGHFLAFFASHKLWKIDVSGGSPVAIAAVHAARGGSWGSKNLIVYAPDYLGPLRVVQPDGSGSAVATAQTKIDGRGDSARWPSFLPDGKHFVYLYSPTGAYSTTNEIHMGSVDGKQDRRLLAGPYTVASYASGYLLAVRDRALLAQRFDPDSGKLSGEQLQLSGQVAMDETTGSAIYSVSQNGMLLVLEGREKVGERQEWFSPQGKLLSALSDYRFYGALRLSPDNSKLSTGVVAGDRTETWIWDLQRGSRAQISHGSGLNNLTDSGVWSPDGERLYYSVSDPTGSAGFGIAALRADGGGEERSLISNPFPVVPADTTADGQKLLYRADQANGNATLSLLPLVGSGSPTVVLQDAEAGSSAQLMPRTNRWMAYQASVGGESQVYVTSFPAPGARYQVSPNGGSQPRWSSDGKQLFYLDAGRHMTAVVVTEDKQGISFSPPKTLFPTSISASIELQGYDVARDGRFLVNNALLETAQPMTLVVNWDAEVNAK